LLSKLVALRGHALINAARFGPRRSVGFSVGFSVGDGQAADRASDFSESESMDSGDDRGKDRAPTRATWASAAYSELILYRAVLHTEAMRQRLL
jgi:hypothetical protein